MDLQDKFFEISKSVVKDQSLELYDIEYLPKMSLLRLYVYNIETMSATLEDCARVDRGMPDFLELDWAPEELTLEVSSPGIYRHLRTPEHFKNAQGEFILVNLLKKLDGDLPKGVKGQKKFRLKLLSTNETGIVLDGNGKDVLVEYENIKKANVEPAWNEINAE